MSDDDPRFYPPIANLRGIERLKILPSRETLKQVLAEALQTVLGLEAKAVHGSFFIYAYAYVREETREAEAVVAGLHLHQDGRLQADICGEDSGTIHYEAEVVNVGDQAMADEVAKAARDLAILLKGYRLPSTS